MNGGHQRDEVIFLQKLKERLRFSPCLFELTDPTDEGRSPGEDWSYWGEFAPSGIFSGMVRIECEPDDEEDISMWCWVKARCSQRHAPAPDLDRFQRFTDALALKLGEAFPLVQPQFDPVEHSFKKASVYPNFVFHPDCIELILSPSPDPAKAAALVLSEVQVPGFVAFRPQEEVDDQIDAFVDALCRLWVSLDELMEMYFRSPLLVPDDVVIVWLDLDTGTMGELDPPVRVPAEYRRPPAYRQLFFAGRFDALHGKLNRLLGGQKPEEWALYGPEAANAYLAGYTSVAEEMSKLDPRPPA